MPNLNTINAGLGQQVYSKIVQPDLANLMGQGFEQMFFDAFDWWNQDGQLPDRSGFTKQAIRFSHN